jgi:hypothetical protein
MTETEIAEAIWQMSPMAISAAINALNAALVSSARMKTHEWAS